MAEFVLKAAPDDEYFVIWGTIVEAPIWAGDRADLLAHLNRRSDGVRAEDRLARAEQTGTSAKDGDFGAWGNDLIYKQQGILPRAHLGELARRLEANNEDVADLLRPFEN